MALHQTSANAVHVGQQISKTVAALPNFDTLPSAGFIRQAQLIPHVVPFSSATLWRKCKSGQFPKPVKISERVTAWRVGDVRQFLDQQQAKAAA